MAEFHDGQDLPFIAGSDLRTHQFKAVRLSAAHKVDVASGAASRGIGILLNKPNTDEGATVRVNGSAPYVAGAAVTAGDELILGTTGFLINGTTVASGSVRFVWGVSRTTVVSGGVGELVFQPLYKSAFA